MLRRVTPNTVPFWFVPFDGQKSREQCGGGISCPNKNVVDLMIIWVAEKFEMIIWDCGIVGLWDCGTLAGV